MAAARRPARLSGGAVSPQLFAARRRRRRLRRPRRIGGDNWTMLAELVSGCTRCKELAATRTQTVFGVGRIDPDVCFIGEAPGA